MPTGIGCERSCRSRGVRSSRHAEEGLQSIWEYSISPMTHLTRSAFSRRQLSFAVVHFRVPQGPFNRLAIVDEHPFDMLIEIQSRAIDELVQHPRRNLPGFWTGNFSLSCWTRQAGFGRCRGNRRRLRWDFSDRFRRLALLRFRWRNSQHDLHPLRLGPWVSPVTRAVGSRLCRASKKTCALRFLTWRPFGIKRWFVHS